MDELTLDEARALLADYAAVCSSRAERIRAAVLAGLGVSEVARILGIGRDTVYRSLGNSAILRRPPPPVTFMAPDLGKHSDQDSLQE